MPGRLVACTVLTLTFAVAGCTGDAAGGRTQTATPSRSASYRPGELTPHSLPDLCPAVSARTLRQLGLDHATRDTSQGCDWSRHEGSGTHVEVQRSLSVTTTVYEPPATRRGYSATDEARYRFRSPYERATVHTVPVRGLGDEAKTARTFVPSAKSSTVWLVVRVRNVVADVSTDMKSRLPFGHGRLPAYGTLEAATLAVATEVVAKLAASASPSPSATPSGAPAYRQGEIRRARDVCRALADVGRRLAPGVPRRDISRPGSATSGGCAWWEAGEGRPDLTVQVEAIPPSPVTGETATRTADELYDTSAGTGRTGGRAVGDEAKARSYGGDHWTTRTSYLLVRKANLLVHVEYDRSDDPTSDQLRRDAITVARKVLAGYA